MKPAPDDAERFVLVVKVDGEVWGVFQDTSRETVRKARSMARAVWPGKRVTIKKRAVGRKR